MQLVVELAQFEKAADSCEATATDFEETIAFAPCSSDPNPTQTDRHAKCLLITIPANDHKVNHEEVAGFALFCHSYSTWIGRPGIHLEDLFIRPAYRRRGFATLMFNRLAQEVRTVSKGKGRLEWNCLKWNDGALKFYEKIGGKTLNEWVGVRVDPKDMETLTTLKF